MPLPRKRVRVLRHGPETDEEPRQREAGVIGPCATCHRPTVRYGPLGLPLCRECR